MHNPVGLFDSDFYSLTLVCEGILDDETVEKVSGAVGYAFTKLGGERLGYPENVVRRDGETSWVVSCDSTKFRSDDWGMRISEVVLNAIKYVRRGSPVRKTNRSGPNTAGTQLIEPTGTKLICIGPTREAERVYLTRFQASICDPETSEPISSDTFSIEWTSSEANAKHAHLTLTMVSTVEL